MLSGLEHAEPRARTDFAKPLYHFQEFLRRRGLVVIISDFYESPEKIVRTIEPLRFHGNEVVLFPCARSRRKFSPTSASPPFSSIWKRRNASKSLPNTRTNEYREKMDAHIADLRDRTRAAGMDYYLLVTDRPLDGALREYLTIRQGKN